MEPEAPLSEAYQDTGYYDDMGPAYGDYDPGVRDGLRRAHRGRSRRMQVPYRHSIQCPGTLRLAVLRGGYYDDDDRV
jgi:hypothetical protein